ncbi:MAG: putative transcriptional regulator containing an HTH domain fused to a Zn-ribbon [uncultured archaeon A07HB70]|nr:MAG: putative transcriptional regulator containing an HTH domain fused to a Zn-ribbon [uncultured archaeon A07HB70]
MDDRTTRQRVVDALRDGPATVSELSTRVGAPRSALYDHLRHVARSLDGADERFLVAPPECRDCGFADFDDPVNRPSRCPRCRSESLTEATFVVRPTE